MNKTAGLLQNIWFLFLCGLLTAPAASFLQPVKAKDLNSTTVIVKPVAGSHFIGDTFEVQVWVENVSDLYGADVQLSFDPGKLEVVDVNPSTITVEITPRSELLYPDLTVKKEADNSNGKVWYAAAQLNPRPPASGSGPLCSFYVNVLSAGQADIKVDYSKLSDKNGIEIPAETFGASFLLYWNFFLPLILA